MGLIERWNLKQQAGELGVGLQVLFSGPLALEPTAVLGTLRKYDPSMAQATFALDAEPGTDAALVWLFSWGEHLVRLVGFSKPMPAEALERCLESLFCGPELAELAATHRTHAGLWYAGDAESPLEQYVALVAVAGALAAHGAVVVTNEASHAAWGAEAFAFDDEVEGGAMLEVVRDFPVPFLFGGLVHYRVDDKVGGWLRTHGNHLLGLPDLARHTDGPEDTEAGVQVLTDVLASIAETDDEPEPGDFLESEAGKQLAVRAPREDEPWLESPGTMLVIE